MRTQEGRSRLVIHKQHPEAFGLSVGVGAQESPSLSLSITSFFLPMEQNLEWQREQTLPLRSPHLRRRAMTLILREPLG